MNLLLKIFTAENSSVGYTLVTSGASCKASGFGRITSLADCQTAPQELGLSFTPKGSGDKPNRPQGCYLRSGGHLWYNTNGQSTAPCDSQSNCVCKSGKCYDFGLMIRIKDQITLKEKFTIHSGYMVHSFAPQKLTI